MFLTDAQLEEMTGYRQRAAQRRWLKKNRVPFMAQAITGKPMVLAASLTQAVAGGEIVGPNLGWIRERKKAA